MKIVDFLGEKSAKSFYDCQLIASSNIATRKIYIETNEKSELAANILSKFLFVLAKLVSIPLIVVSLYFYYTSDDLGDPFKLVLPGTYVFNFPFQNNCHLALINEFIDKIA